MFQIFCFHTLYYSQIWPNPCMDDLPQKLTMQFGSRSTIWGTILHGYRSRWTRLPSGTRSRSASTMPRFATIWIMSTQILPSSMPHPSHLFRYTLVSFFQTCLSFPLWFSAWIFPWSLRLSFVGSKRSCSWGTGLIFRTGTGAGFYFLFSMNQTQVSIFLWNQNWN